MNTTHHLITDSGPEKGREITIPEGGARLGRSSENEITVADGLLSRHHCRLEFRPGDGLWIVDLESANLTMVNDTAVTEQRLQIGDRVLVGDSLLRVVSDQLDAKPTAGATVAAGAGEKEKSSEAAPLVDLDLGFSGDAQSSGPRSRSTHPAVWVAAIIVVILVVFYGLWRFVLNPRDTEEPLRPLANENRVETLQILYEKIEATETNIFRYSMEITPDYTISCQIDDVVNNRHMRKQGSLATNLVTRLTRMIKESGFYGLRERYDGIHPTDLNQWDLTVIVGSDAHRCVIRNQSLPQAFREVAAEIEEFTRSELGIWAIQYSTARLTEMANNAFLRGRKLYEERDVQYGNLAAAVEAYNEAEILLETVEPKPGFISDIVGDIAVAKEELDARYRERSFEADKEMRLKNWETAAVELRIILDLVSDPDDQRYQDAKRKLLQAESRSRKGL